MISLPPIEFDAPREVREALAAMGRTEDVRLAPSGRRLAFACYARNRIAVFDVEIRPSSAPPQVSLASAGEITAPALDGPHGVDFVDDDTLVVASRAGGVSVLRLPGTAGDAAPHVVIDPGPPDGLASPGSVAVRRADAGLEALVCDNYLNTVTRHPLDGRAAPGAVAARRWLDLPDGIAASRDGRWVAVSNHNTHSVLVYEASGLGEDADPVGVLRGVHYPHGLRFGVDDACLLVADAGAPHVHVFVPPDGTWHGVGYPTASVRVIDDATFARAHHTPQEGGPKGIDVDPRSNVLVVTSEALPLAFFDLTPIVEHPLARPVDPAMLVRYELQTLATLEDAKAAAADARAALKAIQRTKAWRMMEPARRLYRGASRLRLRI